jgi:hypothetical protein
MLIQIASDLHLEHVQRRFPASRVIEPARADLLILAGDIHRHARAVETFRDWPTPIIYVLGNHEYYRARMDSLLAEIYRDSRGSRIHVLENDSVVVDGVRFLGATLWTSFEIGRESGEPPVDDIARQLPDFQIIETPLGVFTPAMSRALHHTSRDYLERALEQPFDGPTVVVTHHAPHPRSIHPRFLNNPVNAAFISDLDRLMGRAVLWVHGHVHDSFDYVVHGTRVIANPRGYPGNLGAASSIADVQWENPAFDAAKVVQV